MVDYLITDFNKIRGGGNIKTDTPTLSDFTTENGILSDGSSDGVFILSDENGYVGSVSLSAASSTVTIMSSVVLTATVLDASSDPIEGKSVIFKLDESIIGSGTTNSSGVATYTYSTDGLGGDMVGEHKVKASCKGVESSEVSLTITKGIPTITLSASSSTVSVGGSVTLSGTLSITNTIIYIYDGTTLVNNTTVGNNGNFSITISNLASGTHSYTAVTEADEKYSSVTSSAVNVTAGSTPTPVVTSVALTTSADSITVGGSATLSATVKDQNGTVMSGETVTFYDGLDSLGTATTNSSGVATKSFSSNTVGVHSLTAKCSNVSSSSVSVTVNSKPAPTISLAAASSTVTVGNNVNLSGQLIYGSTPLSNTSVKIYNGNTLVDTVSTNSQGYYTKSVSGLTVGTHSFTAVFEGDSSYASVTSTAVSVTVSKITSTISLSAVLSTISVGDSPQLTGTLSVGSGQSVKIYLGDVLADTVTTGTNGAFSFTGSATSTSGSLTFKAVYDGDSTHSSVTSSNVVITVSGSTPVVDSVSLTADKSILSAYDSESAVLSATVLDSSSNPMSGETVSFDIVSSGTVVENIGTAQTNSSGVATVSYYAEGTGDISIQASVGMIVSETYSIEDCYYVNTGETSSLTIDSGVTCTVEDGAIKITKSSSGEKFVTCKYSYVSDNHEIIFTVPTISSSTNVPLGFAVYTSGSQIYWAGYNKSQGKFDSKGGAKTVSLSAGDTIRIVKSGSNLTAYVNNTSISSVSTATSGVRLAFYTNNGYIQYIDNIKVKAL